MMNAEEEGCVYCPTHTHECCHELNADSFLKTQVTSLP